MELDRLYSKRFDAGTWEKRGRRIAVDLNPDIHAHASPFVEVYNTPAQDLGFLAASCIDAVFVSNFFEHIKYFPGEYWDFFEHYTPLTEKSMCEAIGKFWENKYL